MKSTDSASRAPVLSGLGQEIALVLRGLRRRRGVLWMAMAILAVGIGAGCALFAVLAAQFLDPMVVPDAERVVVLDRLLEDGTPITVPIPTYFDWQDRQRAFEHLGMYTTTGLNLTGTDEPRYVNAALVSAGFFSALGVSPAVGRFLGADADRSGSAAEGVLSHAFWQGQLGGDPAVVGRILRLDGQPFTVIGVAPRGDLHPTPSADLWLPIGAFAAELPWTNRSASAVDAVGRLGTGVTVAAAHGDMMRVTETVAAETGVQGQPQPRLRGLRETAFGATRLPLLLLVAAVALVLLIASVNTANLLVVRIEERKAAYAIRAALGASRGRLVRQSLVEGAVIAGTSAMVGLALAPPIGRFVTRMLGGADAAVLDPRTAGFALAMAAAVALLVGLFPALRVVRGDLEAGLRGSSSRGATARGMLSRAMVVLELSLAVVLLAFAGLMLRSLSELQRVPLGLATERLLTAEIPLPHDLYPAAARLRLVERLLEELPALAGAQAATVATTLPLDDALIAGAIPVDRPPRPDQLELASYRSVAPGFFRTLGIPLRAGRDLDDRDDADAPLVAVVDEVLAERLWPGREAIGQQVAFEFIFPEGGYRAGAEVTPIWREVVGVVGAVRQSDARQPAEPAIYVSFGQPPSYFQSSAPPLRIAIRATGAPAALTGSVREVVRGLDPQLPLAAVATMTDIVRARLGREQLVVRALSFFGALALALVLVGVYGVMAHGVALRQREIGLRVALGATRGKVIALILRQGLVLAALGLVIGLAAAAGFTRLLGSLLYEVAPLDPMTFVGVALVLFAAALVACWWPARRATGIDPVDVLQKG